MASQYLTKEQLHNPNFRFREVEIERIHAQWDQGKGVLLTGIRRTGKSQLIKAALHRYAPENAAVAYMDVQDEDSLPRFYENLLAALLDLAPQSFSEQMAQAMKNGLKIPGKATNLILSRIKKVSVPEVVDIELQPETQLQTYWQPIAKQISVLLAQHPRDQLPIIAIDELPFMLENLINKGVSADELRIMLASLRTLRDTGLRMVIGGSISFENLLSLHDITHTVLGGLFRLSVKPFTRQKAEQYLQEKLKGRFAVHPDAIALVLDTLPDYIPLLLDDASGYLISCKDQAACQYSLDNEIMPAIRRSFLQQFQERLDKNYDEAQLACAEQIFDSLAAAPAEGALLNSKELPKNYLRVLNQLQYDNFIEDAPHGGWRFSLMLIRNWWRNSRGMI